MAERQRPATGRRLRGVALIPQHVRFTADQIAWIRAKAADNPGGIAAVLRAVVDQIRTIERAGLAESLAELVNIASNRGEQAADASESG